ncbi:signal peptidase II [Clostridium thermarum]|uniref:signal peptidase II n=1 Tax=Clostridium thermarum TaxID=1716543 RepID=UPI00111CE3CF|nr:signal peptidase II [Clostridium thermarum]
MEIVIIILGFILDRVTKILSINHLKDSKDITVIKNFFEFQYVENRGAAFGIFQGRQYLLSIITSIVIIGVIVYLIKNRQKSKLLNISLAMIIGGALGNLYDRIIYNYVVDFISWHYKDVYYWPNFNIADILVVVGTALLALYIIKDVKE